VPDRLDFQTLAHGLQDALGGSWSEFVHLLGQRLAELHRVLARCGVGNANPDFAPEPFTLLHQHSLYHSIRGRVRRALAHPEKIAAALPEASRFLAEDAVVALPGVLTRLRRLIAGKLEGQRLRIHGDLRLDHILFTGKDFVFTSFDGPPWLAWSERGFRFSPLHDVAGLIRRVLLLPGEALAEHEELRAVFPDADGWADHWADLSAGLLLDGYLDKAGGERWFPTGEADNSLLLEAFLVERLAFEVQGVAAEPLLAANALRELARTETRIDAQIDTTRNDPLAKA
jgi:maltose alpha-D-glucosyltransferase/alpha-amylase